ncbi:MAG: DUF4287 domain-containing protein [Marinilabiliales bacterium]|nr:DUF4287 domain-containing protein [Marinilabiliales bacterium]
MSSSDKAVQTQIDNIQKKTGKSLDELAAMVKKSGLTKHGEIRDMFKEKLGLGHGDANTLVHVVLRSDGTRAAEGKPVDAVLDEIYTGAKAGFRPIHEKLMKRDQQVRRVRGCAEEGLRQFAVQETIRDDRTQDQHTL